MPALRYKHLWKQQRKIVVNIEHSFCKRSGDHLGLLIKTVIIIKNVVTNYHSYFKKNVGKGVKHKQK